MTDADASDPGDDPDQQENPGGKRKRNQERMVDGEFDLDIF